MQWIGRVVALDDESSAYEDLKDWPLDYYDIDVDVEIAAEYLYAAVHEN